MKYSKWLQFIRYWWQFFPFRVNALWLAILVYTSYRLLHKANIETSSYYGLASLMAKIVLVFGAVMVGFSLLSVLFCIIYFTVSKKANTFDLNAEPANDGSKKLRIKTTMPYALKPFLGFVKLKLVYDQYEMTDKFIVSGRMKAGILPIATGLSSINDLYLPDIKDYSFPKVIVYFEDMLQLFSLATSAKGNQQVINLPKSLLRNQEDIPPKKTEEELVRIEQLRKVEGEHLNYKKFEDSDDVRRIVWKIFAKNKELVVRIPEVMDPFASHIYFYASFFNELNWELNSNFHRAMLNHYKNCVWTLYDGLSKKEFEVRFIHDQSIHARELDLNPTQVAIALSEWQHDTTLIDYFKPKSGSVLCIHSFTPLAELENVLASCESNTTIFFIRLSKTFQSYYVLGWLSRLFLKPPNDELQRMKSRWAWHPLKFKTLNRERRINEVLRKSELNIEKL